MSTVFPISGVTTQPTAPEPKSPDEQFGKDTFLKLLVAQLKFQDPMRPTDSSKFLEQTAMFTQLETLQKIEKGLAETQNASQMLAAASMVGRQVTYGIQLAPGQTPTPTATSVISVRGTLPKDAAVGAKTTISTDVYTRNGTKIPLQLEFRRTAEGWTVQGKSSGQALGQPVAITFDSTGDHGGNLSIPRSALDAIPATAGGWPATGITLAFGDAHDSSRLQLATGPATVTVAEQDGNDGLRASGVVTGVHLTADGPSLIIGGHDIPFASITDVQA
jgi:flagellar basal-body rod modification protein FlgD